jgi:hypothetical protein
LVLPCLLPLLACPPKDDTGRDSPPEGDTDTDTDTDTDADADADADTDADLGPHLSIALTRADDSTSYPPVAVRVTAVDAAGAPWSGSVEFVVENPGGWFEPELDPLTAGEAGTWTTTVRADRSGEVDLYATAVIDGCHQVAHATALFLPCWIRAGTCPGRLRG